MLLLQRTWVPAFAPTRQHIFFFTPVPGATAPPAGIWRYCIMWCTDMQIKHTPNIKLIKYRRNDKGKTDRQLKGETSRSH